ncbi:uncharacterized protein EAF01_007695 [Botrytis porri]|uniref:uncharacterized protein n=1 Tax=Botrytis porri TaxID=87229 RepID=UPI001901C266|nr:uncharacterized protein EAF01_007695 [Botrytis porri]KAF7900393.1 hypothetical protein EAF01_007695 [Botrytis porri]
MKKMFQRQEVLSDLTSQVSYDHSTRSLVIPNSGVEEKRDLPNALLRMPSMCPDESCSRTARGEALHSPLPSNLKIQTDKATISPEDVLPIIATFKPQNSRHQSTITNASYVFFGEEQYKILVDAKEKGEAMKAADHTIGLLTEDYNRTKKSPTSTRTMNKASETNSLSEPHNPNVTPLDLKAPTAPKTMQSDHSTIEDQTLPTSTHRSFIHSSLSQAHDIPTEPAAMRGGHLSSESETSLESNQHDYIRSSLSQTIHIPKGPAAMMRVCLPASDK